MKTYSNTLIVIAAAGMAFASSFCPCASAQTTTQTIYHVYMKTTQLQDHAAGPFSLEAALMDGSDAGDGNSQVIITNIQFGASGSASGDPDTSGDVQGSLFSSVVLSDSAPDSELTEEFIPGDVLTFDLYVTLSLDGTGDSDELVIALVDSAGERIPTTDVNSHNALIRITTVDGTWQSVETYGTDSNTDPFVSGPPLAFAPSVLTDGAIPPPPPLLSLSQNPDTTLTLSWPGFFNNFYLEQTTDLLNWSFVQLPTSFDGTNYTVTVTTDLPLAFFRLAQ